jgi:hypothetical protein
LARAAASDEHELRRLRKPKYDTIGEDAKVVRNISRLVLGLQFKESHLPFLLLHLGVRSALTYFLMTLQ